MDALEGFGDDGADAEELRSFGGPVAGGAGAVFFAGEDDERSAALGILHRGVVDGHRLAFREKAPDATLSARSELIAQADVGEGPADHDFVIATTRAVGVEVGGFDAVIGEVFSRGAVELDGAGGGEGGWGRV